MGRLLWVLLVLSAVAVAQQTEAGRAISASLERLCDDTCKAAGPRNCFLYCNFLSAALHHHGDRMAQLAAKDRNKLFKDALDTATKETVVAAIATKKRPDVMAMEDEFIARVNAMFPPAKLPVRDPAVSRKFKKEYVEVKDGRAQPQPVKKVEL